MNTVSESRNATSPSERRSIGRVLRALAGYASFVRLVVRAPIVLSTLIAVVVTVGAVVLTREQAVQQHRKAETIRLETFAIALSEHVEQAISRGDDRLKMMRDRYLRNPNSLEPLLSDYNRIIDREHFPLDGVIGRDGIMVASSTNIGIPIPRVNLADREHFRFHADQADPAKDEIFFSKIVIGRVSKKPVMQITRAFRSRSGDLLAVGVVSINPEAFVLPYTSMQQSDNIVALIGNDRIGRLRVHGSETTYTIDYRNSPILDEMLQRGQGTMTATSSVDGVPRIYAFRRVRDLPLMVTVASRDIVDDSSILSEEYQRIRIISTLMLLAMAGLLALAVWSQILFLRLTESNKALSATIRNMAMAESAQKQFVASVSHELRTPLHGILGHAQLLELESQEGPAHESARSIYKSALDLRKIVSQLLDLARVEAGKEVLQYERLDLPELIEEVCSLYVAAAHRSGLRLVTDVTAIAGLTISTDALALKRCLHNLINNAIKFTHEGSITVRAVKGKNQSVEITVEDTGIGIRPENLNKVFDYYSYLSRTAKSNVAGTGLGLALCKKLIEMLSGTLTVSSTPGLGSVFRITLPWNAGAEDSQREPA